MKVSFAAALRTIRPCSSRSTPDVVSTAGCLCVPDPELLVDVVVPDFGALRSCGGTYVPSFLTYPFTWTVPPLSFAYSDGSARNSAVHSAITTARNQRFSMSTPLGGQGRGSGESYGLENWTSIRQRWD